MTGGNKTPVIFFDAPVDDLASGEVDEIIMYDDDVT